MQRLKFKIRKDRLKTEAHYIGKSSVARIQPFDSGIKDLAVVVEDTGSKAVYQAASTKKGFTKKDQMQFRKIWLEYSSTDKDYQVELLVE
jgi:hypothetical protein